MSASHLLQDVAIPSERKWIAVSCYGWSVFCVAPSRLESLLESLPEGQDLASFEMTFI